MTTEISDERLAELIAVNDDYCDDGTVYGNRHRDTAKALRELASRRALDEGTVRAPTKKDCEHVWLRLPQVADREICSKCHQVKA